MGYYSLPREDTKKALVEAIRSNADLWLEADQRGGNYDYLIGFMEVMITHFKAHNDEERTKSGD